MTPIGVMSISLLTYGICFILLSSSIFLNPFTTKFPPVGYARVSTKDQNPEQQLNVILELKYDRSLLISKGGNFFTGPPYLGMIREGVYYSLIH